MNNKNIFKDKLTAFSSSVDEKDKETVRKIIEKYYSLGKSAQWIYTAFVIAVKRANLTSIPLKMVFSNFKYDYNEFLTEKFMKEVDEALNGKFKGCAPEETIGNFVSITGDWVNYCHFTAYNYLDVFYRYREKVFKLNKIIFTDKPNLLSKLLTETFKEMGYEVDWTFKEWKNPQKN